MNILQEIYKILESVIVMKHNAYRNGIYSVDIVKNSDSDYIEIFANIYTSSNKLKKSISIFKGKEIDISTEDIDKKTKQGFDEFINGLNR